MKEKCTEVKKGIQQHQVVTAAAEAFSRESSLRLA